MRRRRIHRSTKHRIAGALMIVLGLAMIMGIMVPQIAGYRKFLIVGGFALVFCGIVVLGTTR